MNIIVYRNENSISCFLEFLVSLNLFYFTSPFADLKINLQYHLLIFVPLAVLSVILWLCST